jgi:hypothetical protein
LSGGAAAALQICRTYKEAHMIRILAIVLLAISLASCDATSTLTDGLKQARAVESDLETSIGIRPQVGFNWRNGQLVQVTAGFPKIPETKPLRELAEAVRAAVGKEFKQAPQNVVLAFSLGKAAPNTRADRPATRRIAGLAVMR